MNSTNLIAVLGTTASGKTHLAVELARTLQGEVISADSRQVYRGLDIGSGKDLHEYQEIPYHLIDIVDPGVEYNVFNFQQDFITAFEDIKTRNKLSIMAGGSALYVDAILNGYQLIPVAQNQLLREQLAPLTQETLVKRLLTLKPEQHNTTDLIDRERLIRAIEIAEGEKAFLASDKSFDFPDIAAHILAIRWSRGDIKVRIRARLEQRLKEGLVEEVEQLNKQGVSWETLHFYGLEYRFIAQYLQGELTYNDMVQKLASAINLFAKKQATWLRRLERNGTKIHWLDGNKDLLPQAIKSFSPS